MLLEIDNKYKKQRPKLKTGDIVYRAKCYRWLHDPVTFEIDFDNEYVIEELEEVLKTWINYKLRNIKNNKIVIQQTDACLYKKDVILSIIKPKEKYTQMSLFDFI